MAVLVCTRLQDSLDRESLQLSKPWPACRQLHTSNLSFSRLRDDSLDLIAVCLDCYQTPSVSFHPFFSRPNILSHVVRLLVIILPGHCLLKSKLRRISSFGFCSRFSSSSIPLFVIARCSVYQNLSLAFIYNILVSLMRVGLVLFMVTIALFSRLLRSAFRSIRLRPIPLYFNPSLSSFQSSFNNLQTTTFTPILRMASPEAAQSEETNLETPATKVSPTNPSTSETELPKLSASDFRVFNRLAVMMDAYVCFSATGSANC